jgi:hypothetical protein
LFVSHQRPDAACGEWAAWAATEAHFDYWLDIHDPKLTATNNNVLPAQVKSVLVAGIIEMAFINCTQPFAAVSSINEGREIDTSAHPALARTVGESDRC